MDMLVRMPRGIRNNNPFNIEYNGTMWGGLGEPKSDGRFCRFTSAEYGIRAGCKLLLTYRDKYQIRTVRGIINRFAPPKENDTESYIAAVANYLRVGRNDIIDVRNPDTMRSLARAIIRHENGVMPYDDPTIDRAMELAGIRVI